MLKSVSKLNINRLVTATTTTLCSISTSYNINRYSSSTTTTSSSNNNTTLFTNNTSTTTTKYFNNNNTKYTPTSRSYSSKKKEATSIDSPKTLTLSTYFKFPEFGVHEWANLNRGTAFIVKTPKQFFVEPNRSVYIISCGHITHPFNFPHLYKDETHQWIFALGEQNIKAQLEYRDASTGKVTHIVPIDKPFHLHPTEDLVCIEANLDDFKRSNLPFTPSVLELEVYEEPRKGHTGKLFGYQLVNEKDDIMEPVTMDFIYNTGDANRHFVSTKSPAPMGVCGGPVINFDNEVVGMIEGLVKLNVNDIDKQDETQRRFLHGINSNAVFLPSKIINNFIKEVDIHINDN
ncbi:hypothetical protein DFA_00522 [Cavenderia fasciculata]|uniref:Trypsin-like serine protease n=1 Tax=Cavenderia fasciculata TaxID=261658 RepID=F4PSB5_CACFS|nr:uncharacterized protein DFA_00522 [Cavenderia fasciculata]EGG20661.1 hypothetical protein DFA_00522 [Cavenderia fasciculata]|eukprot:XP_004358511.1 hypothetical protein DFA_00522 [Cavenderia fasciculata]